MEEIEKLAIEIETLKFELDEYLDNPTKTKSKAIRLQLGELKKKITGYRRILVDLDSDGY